MRIKKFLTVFCIVIMVLPFLRGSAVFSDSPTPTPTEASSDNSKAQDLQKQITEYQSKITDLQGQEKTLSSQIAIMDNQIKVTELKIEATKEKIAELDKDIDVTRKKISGLEQNIDLLSKVLIKRMSAEYQVGRIEPWQIFFTSGDLKNFFTRLTYLKMVQAADKRNILAAEQSKVSYANQKSILEDKQKEQEQQSAKLEAYTKELDNEKASKQQLLVVTKNSEKEYQKRLADAMRELQQIQKAANVLVSTEPKDVHRGDVIGFMGNSGYSFGAHLHFGVYSISKLADYNYYSNHENPANSLQSQSVDWDTGCGGDPKGSSNTGSGSFSWPMSTSGLHITQGYGHTCYSDVYYRGNPHPAFDMYNNNDIAIHAVDDGKAYVCRNCTGDGGNGVFLFHPNGKMTLYWHLQ